MAARDLWRSSRPFSWINTALPFLVTAIAAGRPGTLAVWVGVAYFAGPYNLLLYGVNDLYDYDSDVRNPRKGGAVEGGIVPRGRARAMWGFVALTNLPPLAIAAAAGSAIGAAALGLTVLVALAYSVPPVRTKVVPGLDSVTSSLHFVLPAVCGGLLGGAALGELPWRFLAAFFFWGMASHALGAIQDVTYDRQAGIGSIAVALGARRTAVLSLVGYALAIVLVAGAGTAAAAAAAACLLPYLLLAASCLAGEIEAQARRAWRGFLGMNLLVGFLLTQLLLRAWGADRVPLPELLAWGSALGALACLGVAVLNERALARRGTQRSGGTRVTAIVPFRDEAGRIGPCLRALRDQTYLDLELVAVDDGSTDGGVEEAERALGGRGAVLRGSAADPAWTGKCRAAWRGARYAGGEVLVFVDADTRLEPDAIAAAVGELDRRGGMVSLLTRYELASRAERALVPAFVLTQLTLLPWFLVNGTVGRLGVRPVGYGPCMAVERGAYEGAGGHAAIAASRREDLDLARLLARHGAPVRFVRGADLASTRHFHGAAEILACWRRTYYAYAGDSLAVALLGILGVAVVQLGPLAMLLAALAAGAGVLTGSLVGVAALLATRVLVARAERQPLGTLAWHPLTWLATLGFELLSVADGLRAVPPTWRGRRLAMEEP
jgi:4-hydroxybenzoate polyprenyltransferase/GT2 family glycosyltransferase